MTRGIVPEWVEEWKNTSFDESVLLEEQAAKKRQADRKT
jgi:hypothetical protein